MGATPPVTEDCWALGLPPAFDECVLPELSLDGRLVYSTRRMRACFARGGGTPSWRGRTWLGSAWTCGRAGPTSWTEEIHTLQCQNSTMPAPRSLRCEKWELTVA